MRTHGLHSSADNITDIIRIYFSEIVMTQESLFKIIVHGSYGRTVRCECRWTRNNSRKGFQFFIFTVQLYFNQSIAFVIQVSETSHLCRKIICKYLRGRSGSRIRIEIPVTFPFVFWIVYCFFYRRAGGRGRPVHETTSWCKPET